MSAGDCEPLSSCAPLNKIIAGVEKMTAEGPHAYHKTARMAINFEGFCSWVITQDPTQQGSQKSTFVAWDGRDWTTWPTARILPHQTFTFFLH
ncbi:hypothetical protein AVEN_254043-1 [Araneus ventricosus]|uniref:Uncharacterized protein n=1 Tax=Araneus ventricosus TaxID=182803 RepID=A0A4Y2BXT9_ARAVE|nr:hypothetical protein AVEN_254043-1 [Araneus ventricosus]